MTLILNKYGVVVFSIIGALIIVAASWATKGTQNSDTWLYVFSVWLILFSVFEVRSSVKLPTVSRWALWVLTAASAIILGAWWVNGAEHAFVFLVSVAAMVAAFFAIVWQKK